MLPSLRPDAPSQTVFNAGISIDRLSWWFWIKAGMGFTLGAALMAILWGIIFWTTALGSALLWVLAHHR